MNTTTILSGSASPTTDNKQLTLDGSLTSLSWLQTLGCTTGLHSPLSACNGPVSYSRQTVEKKPALPSKKKKGSKEKLEKQHQATESGTFENGPIDSADDIEKPDLCYATLIYMAMKDSGRDKLTLGEIYDYVQKNFDYYKKVRDNGWKNSIRHNLTQHRCFEKIERNGGEPNLKKSCYWALSKDHASMFTKGVFNRKRKKSGALGAFETLSDMKTGASKRKQVSKSKRKVKVVGGRFRQKAAIDLLANPDEEDSIGVLIPDIDMSDYSYSDIEDNNNDPFEGIDWNSFSPNPIPGGDATNTETTISDHATLLQDLRLIDEIPSMIMPDINQNGGGNGEGKARTDDAPPQYPTISTEDVSQQLKDVAAKLDFDHLNSGMTDSWNGQDLTVIGVGLSLLNSRPNSAQNSRPQTPLLKSPLMVVDEDIDMVSIDNIPMPDDWKLG